MNAYRAAAASNRIAHDDLTSTYHNGDRHDPTSAAATLAVVSTLQLNVNANLVISTPTAPAPIVRAPSGASFETGAAGSVSAQLLAASRAGDIDGMLVLLFERGLCPTHQQELMDACLLLPRSEPVHLLVAFGAAIDIRRAYSAVDRLRSPQPFRLMEMLECSPLAHLAVVRPRDEASLHRYLSDRPSVTSDEVNSGLSNAAQTLMRGEVVDSAGISNLLALAQLYQQPWAPGAAHRLFPVPYRATAAWCALFWPRRSALPVELWELIFAFLDRSAFKPELRST